MTCRCVTLSLYPGTFCLICIIWKINVVISLGMAPAILKYMSSDTIICSNLIPIDPRTNTYTLEVIKVTGSG